MITLRFVLATALLSAAGSGRAAEQDWAKQFYDAIRSNDGKKAGSLIQGVGVNVRDSRGATPLMYAAAIGSAETLTLLLDAGADPNAKNDFAATALIWAAGDAAKSRILIERGADVNAASKQGRMPLMAAAKRDGNSGLVRLMLAKGARVDATDGRGNTALMHAAQAGDVAMMRLLTDAGANVNAANGVGATALGNAVCSNRLDAVKFLLAKGAKVNAAIKRLGVVRHGPIEFGNLTPVMAAAPFGSAELIAELLKAGAEVNTKDARGMTALMLAVASETQDIAVVKLLLDAGADPNAKSAAGETALDWANRYGSRPVIAALAQAGAQAGAASHAPAPLVVQPGVVQPGVAQQARFDPREAMNRSLRLLQRSSTEYFKETGCTACHHQILTAMAVRAARRAGIPVDDEAAREQFTSMKAELGRQQEQFLEGIDLFGPQVLAPYLFGLAEAGDAPDVSTDSAVEDLIALQSADGHWNLGLAISRPPLEDGNIARTVQALRALRLFGPPSQQSEIDRRIAQARTWLAKAKPRTCEDSAMLLAGLRWSGAQREQIEQAAHSLMAQQRSDGGWAGNPNLASDAFSTGEALYALHENGSIDVHDRAYQRGIEFLLHTQYDDGSWRVRSRAVKLMPYFESGFPFGGDQWISAAGTAWAAVALAPAVKEREAQR